MRRGAVDSCRSVVLIVVGLALASPDAAWARSFRFEAGYKATRDAFRTIHASWIVPSISWPDGGHVKLPVGGH